MALFAIFSFAHDGDGEGERDHGRHENKCQKKQSKRNDYCKQKANRHSDVCRLRRKQRFAEFLEKNPKYKSKSYTRSYSHSIYIKREKMSPEDRQKLRRQIKGLDYDDYDSNHR